MGNPYSAKVPRGADCEICRHTRVKPRGHERLEVHHVMPRWVEVDDRTSNLAVLCDPHHELVEGVYTKILNQVSGEYALMARSKANRDKAKALVVGFQEGNVQPHLLSEFGLAGGTLTLERVCENYTKYNRKYETARESASRMAKWAIDWHHLYNIAKDVLLHHLRMTEALDAYKRSATIKK